MKTIRIFLFLCVPLFCVAQNNYHSASTSTTQATPALTLHQNEFELVKVNVTNTHFEVFYIHNNILYQWNKNFIELSTYKHRITKYGSFSIMTIPFKVRPAIKDLKQFAKADVKNIGINVGVWNRIWNYYLKNGKINEYKLSFGFIVAPSAEEFNFDNTLGAISKPTTQMVFSGGLNVVGTYKGINFAIIPAGIDIGITSDSKDWVYNGKYWFGIGLGLDSKLIGF